MDESMRLALLKALAAQEQAGPIPQQQDQAQAQAQGQTVQPSMYSYTPGDAFGQDYAKNSLYLAPFRWLGGKF
jgi:hypothetical protein